MLQTLDHHWRDHLSQLDQLRQGIHLRGYAQKNPKQEYKREAFELFSDMLDRVKQDVVKVVLTVQVKSQQDVAGGRGARAASATCATSTPTTRKRSRRRRATTARTTAVAAQPFVRAGGKVGRNDPCPCGSGKKYKQCHGRLG